MALPPYQLKLNEREALKDAMLDRLGLSGKLAFDPSDGPDPTAYICFSCKQSEACVDWLASHQQADAPPDYCRNRDVFKALR